MSSLMAERCDVVVVGAGAMGSATAWWLARRGHDVVLLEQFEAGHTRGSSHGGSRIFRHAYADPVYVRMAAAALPLWRELEADSGRTLLELTGGIDHGPAATVEGLAAALSAEAIDHEVLTPEAAGERWPAMRFDEAVLFHPGAGRCLAAATLTACQERATANGAQVRFGVGPAQVEPNQAGDGVTVRAGDEAWQARIAVVTAGAWVSKVLGNNVALPSLEVTLEQVQHFIPRDHGSEWPSFIHYRVDGSVVYGLRTPGEGVKVDDHHSERVIDPDADSRAADPHRRAAIVRYVAAWFPGLEPEPVNTATCLYTSTRTHDFVIDRVGPVVVGSPCSGHGFKFTPLIGRMLADLADGRADRSETAFARFHR